MIKMRKEDKAREMWDTCLNCTWKVCMPDSKACPYNKKYHDGKQVKLAPVLYQDTAGHPENWDSVEFKRKKGLISRTRKNKLETLNNQPE